MNKIQNLTQLDEFHQQLKTLSLMQSALAIVVESEMIVKKQLLPTLKKIGFKEVQVLAEGKELLELIVKFDGPLLLWFELRPGGVFIDPLLKIVKAMRLKKPLCSIFCGRVDDKLSLAKVLNQKEPHVMVRPLDSKTIEKKLRDYILNSNFS